MWTTILQVVSWAGSSLVGAFAGSYLTGYLKTKGENLATHEDIDKLVDQVGAVTKKSAFLEKYHQARVTFARAKILAMVACSKEVRNQFDLVGESLDVGAKRALAGDMPAAWDKLRELWKQVSQLVAMVRKDLDIDGNPDATPQSNVSSATPSPAGQGPQSK